MDIQRCLWAAMAVWAATLCPLPALGQAFQDLSTTEDGSVLYFSSPIRQKGTDQSFHSKIFRWDASGGFRLVAEVRDEGESDCSTGGSFYQLSAPQVSADGTVLAYTGNRPAFFGFGHTCVSTYELNQGIVQQPGREVRLDGNLAISRNGRYAITTPNAAATSEFHIVTDLASGLSNVIAGAFNGSGRRVTDDGTIITPEPSAVIITDRNGGTRVVQTQRRVDDSIIDRSGNTITYVTRIGPLNPGAISFINVATGNETPVTTGLAPANPSLTSDGSTILFIQDRQLFGFGIGGNTLQLLTNEKDGIASAVISGDGRVAYAVTGASRLVRLDVTSGAVTELAPATPLITAVYRVYAPATSIAAVGSLMDLYGFGLSSVRQVGFCGRPVPILGTGRVRFQVPWDLPEGTCQVSVQSDSPFEHAISLEVKAFDPQFAQLAHQRFNGLITESNPAHPGEVIVAYMSGLGSVDNNDQLMPGFRCGFQFNSVQDDVLYAGLAPGFTGFYQVNVRVPNLSTSSALLSCGWNSLTQASTTVPLGPP